MSDWKLFTKLKPAELRAELDQAYKKSKPHNRVKIVLKKIIANIILNNNELVSLMPDVIALMKIDDLEIRKMCFQYLVNYAHLDEEGALNALPFLARFQDDSNSTLRALAIKTTSSINLSDFIELSFKVIRKAIGDSDPYVRRKAVFAIARLYEHDSIKATSYHLVDNLNELLYDPSPIIVSNVLAALNSITEQTNSMMSLTIDQNNCKVLVSFLSKTNEWNQVYILNALMSYAPQTTEEALDLIEAIMPSLQHENAAVVLNSIKVIVFYSNYVQKPELVLPTLPKRLGSSLVSLLSKPAEIQFLVLRNVILLLLGKKHLVQFDVEMFFCRYDDPIYVKDTKLEIIYLLANEQNVSVVLRELEEYATEVDVAMARKAVRAFGNLAVKISNAATQCVHVLCDLTSNGISYIVQESTIVIKNILRKYPGEFNFAIEELVKHYKLIDEPDAKTAMIWILGQYSHLIPNTNVILEDFISSFKDDPIEVQYAALTSVTKFYLQSPEKGEPLVIKILKCATEDIDNPDIRDRGFFYWRLISSENASDIDGTFQKHTKEIILNTNPVISADNDSIDPVILEELELNIGTLASIYLKPIQYVFRLAKRKQLSYTPALQDRPFPTPPVSANTSTNNSTDLLPTFTGNRTKSPELNAHNLLPPPPPNRRTSSTNSEHSSRSSRLGIPRQASFDSGFSSNEDSSKKNSFAKRLSRKASVITGRKNSKF